MFGLGAGEIFLILVLALVFLGPKKLPELAKNLGKGLRELQNLKNSVIEGMHSTSTSTPSETHSSSPFSVKETTQEKVTIEVSPKNETGATQPYVSPRKAEVHNKEI